MSNPQTEKITPEDLENKLRAFQNDVQGRVDDQRSTLVTAGVVGLVVLLLLFFFLGKRSGRRRTTLVEIKRI